MERRVQPRVQLPLEIDLRHPSIGSKRVVARDLNDTGVFAWYPDAPFKLGSAVEITLRRPSMIDSGPTPTVKMTVLRIDKSGIALGFSNKSCAHLWRWATPDPSQLEVGKDLFRFFQAAIVRNSAGKILVVQQNGRWLFPGTYLQAGQPWLATLQNFIGKTFHLTDLCFERTVHTHCEAEIVALESSTMSVFHLFSLPNVSSTVAANSPYTKARWLGCDREVNELSFSAEPLRELARDLIRAGERLTDSPQTQSSTSAPQAPNRKHG